MALTFHKPGGILAFNSINEPVIDITQANYKAQGIIFTDCRLGRVTIKETDLQAGIKFVNSTVRQLVITGCTATVFDPNFNLSQENIILDNCNCEGSVVIQNCLLEGELKIKNCPQINKLSLIQNDCRDISISSSTITNIEAFLENRTRSNIFLENSTFYNFVRFENNICQYFAFINSTFKGDCWMWGGSVSHGITFNRGIYEDSFKIEAVKSKGTLTFVEADFKKNCDVSYENDKIKGGCPQIVISSSSFTTGLTIKSNIANNNQYYEIDGIKIICTSSLKGLIRIEGFVLNSLSLTGMNSTCVISFYSLLVKTVLIDNYSNFSTTQFFNISSPSTTDSRIEITKSYLGKTHFSDFNFKSYKKISIAHSVLTEITSTNVEWFEPNQVSLFQQQFTFSDSTLKGKKINKTFGIKANQALRELYRQLKFAQEKQGNTMQALIFKRYEYEAFQEEIKYTSFKSSYQDRITLFLASINKHGTNWLRPIIIIIIWTISLSFLITASISGQLHFCFSLNGLSNLIEIGSNSLNYFFQLLSPAFTLDRVYTSSSFKISSVTYALALLHRIILSVLIYQTIVAFRKYSK